MTLDLEALLVALALAPATYSRNRFFSLYTDPAARRTRRRAALLRNVVRHLTESSSAVDILAQPTPEGGVRLSYQVPALGLKRTLTLDPIELALVRYAMTRVDHKVHANKASLPAALAPQPSDGLHIEAALARLLPTNWHDQLAVDENGNPVPPSVPSASNVEGG